MTEQQLAAWESETVLNLNPMLSFDHAAALWAVIEANRAAPDASAFAECIREIVARCGPMVFTAAQRCVQSLETLLAAGAPAKE